MAEPEKVAMRLVRDSDAPPSPDGSAFLFGLEDNKGAIVAGERGRDGRFVFDFELDVKGDPAAGPPVFTGRFPAGRGRRASSISPGGAPAAAATSTASRPGSPT